MAARPPPLLPSRSAGAALSLGQQGWPPVHTYHGADGELPFLFCVRAMKTKPARAPCAVEEARTQEQTGQPAGREMQTMKKQRRTCAGFCSLISVPRGPGTVPFLWLVRRAHHHQASSPGLQEQWLASHRAGGTSLKECTKNRLSTAPTAHTP